MFTLEKTEQDVMSAVKSSLQLCQAIFLEVLPLVAVIELSVILLSYIFGDDNGMAMPSLSFFSLIALLVYGALHAYEFAAVLFAADDATKGVQIELSKLSERSVGKLATVFVATVIVALLTSIGFMLLVIPGFIAMVLLIAVIPLIVYENKGIYDAIKRSVELVTLRFWFVAGVAAIISIGLFLIGVVIVFLTGLFGSIIGSVFLWGLYILRDTLLPCAACILYHNLIIAQAKAKAVKPVDTNN